MPRHNASNSRRAPILNPAFWEAIPIAANVPQKNYAHTYYHTHAKCLRTSIIIVVPDSNEHFEIRLDIEVYR